MARLQITPRRVMPYIVGGVSGLHTLARMRRLSRRPASDAPLHLFLLKHTDVLLVMGGSPIVIWHLAKRSYTRTLSSPHAANGTIETTIPQTAHQLRQVFTALLLGLGLMSRKLATGKTMEISRLIQRLQSVSAEGIQALNALDPPTQIDKPDQAREV